MRLNETSFAESAFALVRELTALVERVARADIRMLAPIPGERR